jgi:hypothetical protein
MEQTKLDDIQYRIGNLRYEIDCIEVGLNCRVYGNLERGYRQGRMHKWTKRPTPEWINV